MKRRVIAAAVAGLFIVASAVSIAAEPEGRTGMPAAGQGMHDMQGMEGMHGMEGMRGMGCMKGMANMMQGMQGMMGGQTGSAVPLPQLPPGNEKLQLQMWGEVMQKVGEIVGKYAAQAK